MLGEPADFDPGAVEQTHSNVAKARAAGRVVEVAGERDAERSATGQSRAALGWRFGFRGQVGPNSTIAADQRKGGTKGSNQQARVHPEADGAKPLVDPLSDVLVARRNDSAVLACPAKVFLHPEDLLRDSWSFPLAAMTGPRRKIRWAEPEQVRAFDLAHRWQALRGQDGLEDRHDEDVVIRLDRVLDHRLAPGRGPLRAEASDTFERVTSEPNGLGQLIGRFDE